MNVIMQEMSNGGMGTNLGFGERFEAESRRMMRRREEREEAWGIVGLARAAHAVNRLSFAPLRATAGRLINESLPLSRFFPLGADAAPSPPFISSDLTFPSPAKPLHLTQLCAADSNARGT